MAYFSVSECPIIGGIQVRITYSTSSVLLVTSAHSSVVYNMLGDWLCAVTKSVGQGEVGEFRKALAWLYAWPWKHLSCGT